MTLTAAGSGFCSQIHSAGPGGIHDFLITGANASTSIAISADTAFLNAMDCLLVYRDNMGTRKEIDLWPLILGHFAAQIRRIGEAPFTSIVADDIRELVPVNGETKETSLAVTGLAAHLFAHALSHETRLEPPCANEQIPIIHWMQFVITPLLLSPILLGSIMQADQLPDGDFSAVLLRFRHSSKNGPLTVGTPETDGHAAVLVSEGQSRSVKIIKDLKQIRRQLGPMGVLQRSLLVPILETVCELAEHPSEQHGAS